MMTERPHGAGHDAHPHQKQRGNVSIVTNGRLSFSASNDMRPLRVINDNVGSATEDERSRRAIHPTIRCWLEHGDDEVSLVVIMMITYQGAPHLTACRALLRHKHAQDQRLPD